MPTQSDNNAPKFDGEARSLCEFFEEVETWGRTCSLKDDEIIKYSIQYISFEERVLWEGRKSAESGDLELFKKYIYRLYPGSEDGLLFSVADLDNLVKSQARKRMLDKRELGIYY